MGIVFKSGSVTPGSWTAITALTETGACERNYPPAGHPSAVYRWLGDARAAGAQLETSVTGGYLGIIGLRVVSPRFQ
jgi:hypothetical protein